MSSCATLVEPSYKYDEDLMMASIQQYKHELRKASDDRIAKLDAEMRAIRDNTVKTETPTALDREIKKFKSWQRCRSQEGVPVVMKRHVLTDSSVLPRWAYVCCLITCKEYRIKLCDLTQVSNKPEHVLPRQLAAYLMVRVAGFPFTLTARCLGGLHHTTIMYGVKMIERKREADETLGRMIDRCRLAVEVALRIDR